MKINDKYSADFFYSSSTYTGVYIASPERLIEAEDNFVDAAKDNAKEFIPNKPIQVIKRYREDGTLKPRVNITLLMKFEGKGKNYTSKCLGLVWFDEDEISIEESLMSINHIIDWDKARDFDF